MEETKRKFPSLPPNYVSLQQLQEQRLREQQQKQEEEQRLKQEKEKQQQQQKEAEEEDKKKLLVSQKAPRIRTKTSSNRNGRNFSQKSWLIKEKNEAVVVVLNPDQKLEEVEPKRQKSWLIKEKNEAVVVLNPDQKVEEVEPKKNNRYKGNCTSEIQKGAIEINVDVQAEEVPDPDQNLKEIRTKKRRKRNKGKKPMVEEETLTLIEEDMKKSLPPATIPNENNADVKNTRTGFRRRNQKPPPPESVNQTIEIEQKIGDLKISDDDDEKKSTVEKKKKNGDYYYSGVMRSRKMVINRRKPMDRNLMWIRKDEKTDGFPVSSGCIAGNI